MFCTSSVTLFLQCHWGSHLKRITYLFCSWTDCTRWRCTVDFWCTAWFLRKLNSSMTTSLGLMKQEGRWGWVTSEVEMTREEMEGRVEHVPGSIGLSFMGIMEEKMKILTTVYFAGSLEAIYQTYANEVHNPIIVQKLMGAWLSVFQFYETLSIQSYRARISLFVTRS